MDNSIISVPSEYNNIGGLLGLGTYILLEILNEETEIIDFLQFLCISKKTYNLKDQSRFRQIFERLKPRIFTQTVRTICSGVLGSGHGDIVIIPEPSIEERNFKGNLQQIRYTISKLSEGTEQEQIESIDAVECVLKEVRITRDELIYLTSFVEELRLIQQRPTNELLKRKIIRLALQTGTYTKIAIEPEDNSIYNQISAIIIKDNRAIKIRFGGRSILNGGMIIPLNPEITVEHGIYRCDMKFEGRKNTIRVGICGQITDKMKSFYYCPGSDKDSVGFEKTGEIIHCKQWIPGNDEFKDDDIVGMEVNMIANPRTLFFFVNDKQQRHFFTGIPEKIRFCGYLNSELSSFRVTSLKQMSVPSADYKRNDAISHNW
ncbi:MAG: hypothetical protein EZS28_033020 [Streblomastix strix]|uniref:B30.2/SPRY domain-containing protein n=1 Tax=Streblomastix strix TaxID=222440 RepID=A0A5J4UMD4_9EUKA|nr:MAG: hypothetical protein EZS28_033020 [Streblomastix strix]